jgi:uncharacterized protein (TIGR02118 family)
MVKLTVIYGRPDDPDAFEEYYENTHMPLARKMPNVQKIDLAKVVVAPDGSEPPYRTEDVWFEDMDQLQSALVSPEGQETAQDIQNFATGGATIFVSEVEPGL